MNRTAYRRTFLRLSNRVERTLSRALYVLLVILILSQILLQYEPIRYWLSETVRLEGEGISTYTIRTDGVTHYDE